MALPPSLRPLCQDPPWTVSAPLFNKTRTDPSFGADCQRIEILPSDPEFHLVFKSFSYQPPTELEIKRIWFIHNARLSRRFEEHIGAMEREAKRPYFQPRWRNEDNIALRGRVFKRFTELASHYSPFSITLGNKKETCTQVKVLPLWHGTTRDSCASICESGFYTPGKHALHGKGEKSDSRDIGYFGDGIYFTTSARYAAEAYSDKENLLFAWVAMREPYPVINDKPPSLQGFPQRCSDMEKLQGLGHRDQHNAHYIPVSPANSDRGCTTYYPTPSGMEPHLDEFAVYESSQALCRIWIEIGRVEIPKMMPLQPFLGQLLDLMIKLADHPDLRKNYPSLAEACAAKADVLADVNLPETSPYTEDSPFFELARRVLTHDNRIDPKIAEMLMQYPPLSVYHSQMRDKNLSPEVLKKIPPSEFISAISKEPQNGALWCNLGRSLTYEMKIGCKIFDKIYTILDVYIKAISLDPTNSLAYHNLAWKLPPGGKARLENGVEMTVQELYLRAVDLEPTNSLSLNNLSTTLPDGGHIQLLNGTIVLKEDLLKMAIEFDPSNSLYYRNLALTLPAGGGLYLRNGIYITKEELLKK